jgi:hypothetical protein
MNLDVCVTRNFWPARMNDETPNRMTASSAACRGGNDRPIRRFFASLNRGVLWAIVILALSVLPAKAEVSREYQIKAVFLYNFAQFTQWPEGALPAEKSPIIIGIVGPDPFGPTLVETVHGETILGHPLIIEHFAHPADIKTCHILFISQPEVRHCDEILKTIKGKPVLTVGDTDSSASASAIIRFVVEKNKVHFRVNAEAARAANITLSSKLLRVAEVPPTEGRPP